MHSTGRRLLLALLATGCGFAASPVSAAPVATAPVRPGLADANPIASLETLPSKTPDAVTEKALERFNRDRFAMFIHWGLYSQAGGIMRGERYYGLTEWIMKNSKTPTAEYLAMAKDFNPTAFDAREWIRTAKAAGVKYIVITTKHHEGFAMFDSKASDNTITKKTPFKRDPLKELADAAAAEGIGLGFYYSQFQDWTEPNGGGNDWEFDPGKVKFDTYFDKKVIPQVTELLTKYGKLREIWFDTPGTMGAEYSKRLYDLVKRYQPECLVNSRIGNGYGDYTSPPDSDVLPASLARNDWEAVFTHNDSWGYSNFDQDFKSTSDLIYLLALSASRGGNFMINMGPDEKGRFPAAATERLLGVGKWLKANGESIYGTERSPIPQTPWGVVTQKPGAMYLHIFNRPSDRMIVVPNMAGVTVRGASLLADGRPLTAIARDDEALITLPADLPADRDIVVKLAIDGKPAAGAAGPALISNAFGMQSLDVADATREGDGLELVMLRATTYTHDYRKFYTVTGLNDPSRSLSWRVRVDAPGDYHLDLQYAAIEGQEGRAGTVVVADQTLTFKSLPGAPIRRSGVARIAPTQLIDHPIGTIHFTKPGIYEIKVAPEASGPDLFHLRSAFLTPVD